MLRRTLSRLATASCLAAAAFIAPASAATDETVIGPVLVKEANSKALCESVPHRIFVSHFAGTECVAFHVSPGTPTVDTTVIYFNGDIPAEYFAKPKIQDDIVKDITVDGALHRREERRSHHLHRAAGHARIIGRSLAAR